MDNEYKQLLERQIRCQENANDVSTNLLKVAERLEENTKKLNDGFVLHQAETKEVSQSIHEMRSILFKWLMYMGLALFLIMGGLSIYEKLTGGL